MSNFVLQLPLITNKYQDDVLNKRFEIGRKMYNSMVNVTQKRYKEMVKTKEYRIAKSKLFEIYNYFENKTVPTSKRKEKAEFCEKLNSIRKKFNINEYSFHSDVKYMQRHFKTNIDSSTAQKIASNLWRAYDKLMFGDGEKISFKRYNSFNSLEGKTNKTGIKFRNFKVFWNGLDIPVKTNSRNNYEAMSFKNEISYCRIVRKFIKNKYKFYVQLVFKGVPVLKAPRYKYATDGDVGLDIGTQTIAISSDKDVKIYELADRVIDIEKIKLNLSRKLDRSRRKNNPGNYNDDGTIKKQGSKKVFWNISNRYIKQRDKLKNIHRKISDIRKYQHECLANEILMQGNKIYVETMNFKALQKRSRVTKKNDNTGRISRKKRFGKSIGNKAPAMLLSIIDRKLKYRGSNLIKIDTWSVKASQYNHLDGSCTKKKLSQRWSDLSGIKVQRDMYSAFLIMNVNEDLKSVNKDKCDKKFENFLKLHNLEVSRLKGSKNLSSIAI